MAPGPEAPAEPQAEARVPLDEVMLAMDVVDTLRHDRALVQEELDSEGRRRRLIARVKSIYESQGMDVPDAVIAEGVRALEEDRFTYEPPARTVQVRLAEAYIDRGRWALRLLIVLALASLVWLAFWLPARLEENAKSEAFRRDLAGLRAAARTAESGWTELDRATRAIERPDGAARQILADARRGLTSSRADLRQLQRALMGAPAAGHVDRRESRDSFLAERRASLGRITRTLGGVKGRLDALARLRSLPARLAGVVARLADVELSDAARRALDGLQARVRQAGAAGDAEAAERALAQLETRVASHVQAHAQRVGRRAELARLVQRAATMPLNEPTKGEILELQASAQTALASHDDETARRDLADLAQLVTLLDQSYELRIVARPGERSGVWRTHRQKPGIRNYYVVVEAVGPDGKTVALRVTNEETGRQSRVRKFGIRVPEAVYAKVKSDKLDNGIIDDRVFGRKQRGQREVTYRFAVEGGRITRW